VTNAGAGTGNENNRHSDRFGGELADLPECWCRSKR
jgi:hypothetical protein